MALIFVVWVLMILTYSLLLMQFFNDPTAVYETYQGVAFLVFKVIIYIVIIIILLTLIFLFYQFFRSFNRLQRRYKIIGLLNAYFIILISVLLFLGTFQTYQFQGARILISIS